MTPIILILGAMSLLAIALGTLALVLGRPDQQARSEIHILREEVSTLWERLEGEIKRQAVRASRQKSATTDLQAEVSTSSSANAGSLNREMLVAEFERRQKGKVM